MEKSILYMFPQEYRELWRGVALEQAALQEIRLRIGKPAILLLNGREAYVTEAGELTASYRNGRIITERELRGMLEHICHYSPYAFEEELRRGFLTVAGGHRVGVAGQVVLNDDGTVRTIKNISFANIRVSHQIKGAADEILPVLYKEGTLKNVLLISPPGCGKTTLLRDMIRRVSDGNLYARGMTVGVVDERSEIAGTFQGIPQNDLGMRTDVLDGCPKEAGMLLLLRSMSPAVIAIDELGNERELSVLGQAAACGCRILATAHGEGLEDVRDRFRLGEGRLEQLFDLLIVLGKENGKCVVRQLVGGNKDDEVACQRYDSGRMSGVGSLVSGTVYRAGEGTEAT